MPAEKPRGSSTRTRSGAGRRPWRTRLTDELARCTAPQSSEFCIEDDLCPDFFLRIQPSGAKSWILRRTVAGRSQRQLLGSTKTMSVDGAREAIQHRRLQRKSAATAKGILFDAHLADYIGRGQLAWAQATLKAIKSYARKWLLPAFSGRALEQMSRVDVVTWFHAMSRTSPGGANRVLDILKAMLNDAHRRGVVAEDFKNPCERIRRNRRKSRAGIVGADEMWRLDAALNELAMEKPVEAAALRLLLLTGCRKNEILSLTWKQVEPPWVKLPKTKNGPDQKYITEPVAAILDLRRQDPLGHPDHVLPNYRNGGQPFAEIAPSWRRVLKTAGLPSTLRIHDLRHTYASHSLMSGESLFVTGKLLGHRRIETTAGYSHLHGPHLLVAAEKVANKIWALLNIPDLPSPTPTFEEMLPRWFSRYLFAR